MKNEIKRIIKELNLEKNIKNIEIEENKNMFYQKIISIQFNNHDDRAIIILNAFNKKQFKLNNYEKSIKEQIMGQRYLFGGEL